MRKLFQYPVGTRPLHKLCAAAFLRQKPTLVHKKFSLLSKKYYFFRVK
ncbi:hypothetical protein FAEPRAM212_02069 [Faecalibacterium prausnitzii M21/2]|uniref:Uncharacterized protein n=1 Tax=Faecalibacterium prausnitzii M21/2 TaxID=411485 RepID=A8SCU9_9FIRM|nr:hypothetical protein FAEPRAM212_02069 [Faecalibacterium prausnitzii M21/2]